MIREAPSVQNLANSASLSLELLRPTGVSISKVRREVVRHWVGDDQGLGRFRRWLLLLLLPLLVACGGGTETGLVTAPETAGAPDSPLPTAGAASSGGSESSSAGAASEAGAPSAGGTGFSCAASGGCGTPETGGGGGDGGTRMVTGGASSGAGSPPTQAGGGAGGSMVDPCEPVPWEAACAGNACGPASDGCGNLYGCGSCPGLSECVEGSCKATCAVLQLECGAYPAQGLDCGDCDAGEDCGVVGTGKCSACVEAVDFGGVCNAARPHLMKPCGDMTAQDCRRPFNQDLTWWCCP